MADLIPALTVAAAVIAGILSAARLTRLLAQDSFPPSAWARARWDDLTDSAETPAWRRKWNVLLHCHWCLAPYFTAIVLAWGWLSDLHWSWWAVNGWLAASYLASMVVERDEVE